MPLSRIGLLSLIMVTIIIAAFNYFSQHQTNHIVPSSVQNEFYYQLNHALYTAQIKPLEIKFRDFSNEVEFYIQQNDNIFTKIILSTQKNPYIQVASLQKIFSIAKIKGKNVNFIDLSISHPYATL